MASESTTSRIHLDAIGGLSGDMFVAALIDAAPEHADALLQTLRALPVPEDLTISLVRGRSGAISGQRFVVATPQAAATPAASATHRHNAVDHHHDHHHPTEQAGHSHRAYRDIRTWLEATSLTKSVKTHAQAMFAVLAEAEARVHGIAPEDVTFHEVGAWDSIIDFVAAAWLIDAHGAQRWTWSPLPLGSGRIHTAHGTLPVPAPATALLLSGMEVVDDGIPGERVTPTGAAILKHLANITADSREYEAVGAEIITTTGFGLGSRALPDMPNVARCIAFARAPSKSTVIKEEVGVIQFEVDDQSPEDIAVALDSIRRCPGTLEVYQAPLLGKKGRLATQIQILVECHALDTVADICFEETTTLGLRIAQVSRRKLSRQTTTVHTHRPVRVKLAMRPSGHASAKAEMDDLAGEPDGHVGRERVRIRAEHEAIEEANTSEYNQ